MVRELPDSGCRASILTSPKIESAALQISRGVDPKTFTETWKHDRCPECATPATESTRAT
ncbi:type VII secretion protein EccE [Rhodococcus sp. JS3073]|nr:type VII secretion protein EccE [Rhodococcus sp. JS3073]WAM18638.1 type VII secretion protein EccE [Rhodococcus sp. JS3073]